MVEYPFQATVHRLLRDVHATLRLFFHMKKSIPLVSSALLMAVALSSCETPGQTALLGAGTGAIIGNQSHTGPVRGAALGAGVGYLVGRLAQRDRRRAYDDGYYDARDERRYHREERYEDRRRYPVARPTNRYGFVTSPYAPYNVIDVRDIPRGAQVVDPSVDRVFINP